MWNENVQFDVGERVTGLLGAEPVCIKPATEGGGVGVARLDSAVDLAVYAGHLRERHEAVEELTLSWGNPPILLPAQTPSHFLIEPFIQADRYITCQSMLIQSIVLPHFMFIGPG